MSKIIYIYIKRGQLTAQNRKKKKKSSNVAQKKKNKGNVAEKRKGATRQPTLEKEKKKSNLKKPCTCI